MSLNHFVDAAVDKAAVAAKMKVKSMLGGGGGGGGGDAKKPGKSGGIGGIGGLFPSAGDSGNGDKEKKGGKFGLFTTPQDEMNPGGAGGGTEGQDFNSAVDELAGF